MDPLVFQETVLQLSADAALPVKPGITYEMLEELLAQKLEDLISNNFQQFVLLLYKIDVSESKVREIFGPDVAADAYHKLAAVLIERQQQKIISRKATKKPSYNDDGEERW
jgi:hypothetical protein